VDSYQFNSRLEETLHIMEQIQTISKKAKTICANDETDFDSETIDIKSEHKPTTNSLIMKERASTYFKDTIRQVLTDVLIDSVKERPEDPVEFVANALERDDSE
jgi:polyphosphate kinase